MALRVRDNFVAGIAVVLPLVVTVWLLQLFIKVVNARLLEPLLLFVEPYLNNNEYLILGAKAAVFIMVICFIYLIGLGTRILFVRKFFALGETAAAKIFPACS